jgi:hypothetical protein
LATIADPLAGAEEKTIVFGAESVQAEVETPATVTPETAVA